MTTISDTRNLLLQHHTRKAEFGRLLAEIDHEWKQPLNTISLLSSSLLTFYNDNRLNEDVLLDLQNRFASQVNALNDIIASYRKFYSPTENKEHFNVISTLNSTLIIINYLLVKQQLNITIKGDTETSLFGPTSDFQQVMISLIDFSNGVFSKKGLKDKQISVEVSSSAEQIVIIYNDNSTGVDPTILQSIFEEDTSKTDLDSASIGMHLAHAIITQIYKGTITVSNTEKGLNFTITFNMNLK